MVRSPALYIADKTAAIMEEREFAHSEWRVAKRRQKRWLTCGGAHEEAHGETNQEVAGNGGEAVPIFVKDDGKPETGKEIGHLNEDNGEQGGEQPHACPGGEGGGMD